MAFCYGLNEKDSKFVLYRGCTSLSDSEIEAIIAHELSHIKNDLDYNTFRYVYSFNLRTYWRLFIIALFSIVFVGYFSFLVWEYYAGLISSLEMLFGFIVPTLSWLALNIASSSFQLSNLAPEMYEFRADLISAITIGNPRKVIEAIDGFRFSTLLSFSNDSDSKNIIGRVWDSSRGVYRKIMKKGKHTKRHSNWLAYFKQSYFQIILSLGHNFDYPNDELRKDFLKFVDETMNSKTSYQYNPEKLNFIKSFMGRKMMADQGQIANYSFVNHDLSWSSFERVIEYLDSTHKDFNSVECSADLDIELYQVILTIIILLVNDVIRQTRNIA
jgi:hypothetical protein